MKWLSYDTVNVESGFRLPLAPPDFMKHLLIGIIIGWILSLFTNIVSDVIANIITNKLMKK